jgi:hypothetical protein
LFSEHIPPNNVPVFKYIRKVTRVEMAYLVEILLTKAEPFNRGTNILCFLIVSLPVGVYRRHRNREAHIGAQPGLLL